MWFVQALSCTLLVDVILAKWLVQIHAKLCTPPCTDFSLLFLLACDDECVGVLLNDLGDVGDTILSVNLTGVIPIPYGILSTLENTTKSLRVGTGNTEIGRNLCPQVRELVRTVFCHSVCPLTSVEASFLASRLLCSVTGDFTIPTLTCSPMGPL